MPPDGLYPAYRLYAQPVLCSQGLGEFAVESYPLPELMAAWIVEFDDAREEEWKESGKKIYPRIKKIARIGFINLPNPRNLWMRLY